MEPSERFSGLSNQGATCYMNSLLQTLFMTPEFLSRLYQWKWDENHHSSKEHSIPYQLQLLFAKLHLLQSPVIETTGLTRSFQWSLRDCLQQHDVQEFCRELFAAIEESVRGTTEEKMITELYEGTYVDYVKCLSCHNQSDREDKFLDLSLAVRGQSSSNDSLEKALEEYVRPDMLSGENKYFCESCSQKSDAKKGMKVSQVPFILALQLKRFDLDYSTMQRKKINDRVTFPLFLDVSVLMKDGKPREEEKMTDISFGGLGREEGSAEQDLFNTLKGGKSLKEDQNDENRNERSTEGENNENFNHFNPVFNGFKDISDDGQGMIFELFSVMVHSGSALGGHYLAYIKSFSSGKWYSFNDSVVKEIDEKELEKAFGGPVGNGVFGSNAYMLMYRKISEKNLKSVSTSEIPEYLLADIREEEEEKQRNQKLMEERLMQIETNVFMNNKMKKVIINKTLPLKILKKLALNEFRAQIEEEDVRIRKYDPITDQLLESFEGKEHLSMETLDFQSDSNIWLETKSAEEDFPIYRTKGIHLKIALWTEQSLNSSLDDQEFYRFTVPLHYKLRDLISLLGTHFKLSFNSIRLWRYLKVLNSEGKLKDFHFIEMTEPKNLNLRLLTLKITDGFSIYLDQKHSESNWKQKFFQQSSSFLFSFNDPKSNDSSFSISELKSSKVSQLKERLSVTLNYEPNSLSLRRGSPNAPLLNDSHSLEQSGLYNHCRLFLDLESPLPEGFLKLRVFQAVPSESSEEWFSFNEGQTFALSASLSNLELKNSIFEVFKTENSEIENFRIREKVDKRLMNVISCLKDLSLWKSPEICVEQEPEPQDFEIICVFRFFDANTWKFSPLKSLNIAKDSSLEDLEMILQVEFETDDELELTRVTYTYNFKKDSLVKADWVKMKGTLCEAPLFVKTHGTCFM
jgi:ubiquitin C-terminal hydrolase